ncbi:MAG: hypothetical protein ACP5H2_02915 [Solirubrobacteraceae bacterium]
MSFFDEDEEPEHSPGPAAARPRSARRPRAGGGGRPPRGPGRPPSTHTQQQIQTRRGVAVVIVVVIVIVMALLIHGCEVSQSTNSLKTYAADVDTLMTDSGSDGVTMFSDLSRGDLSSTAGESTLSTQLNTLLQKARGYVIQAEKLSAPSQLSSAETTLVQVMRLRADGIATIADNIQPASVTSTSQTAVASMTRGFYMLSGSDVLYKTFVGSAIAQALNSAAITVGGQNGIQIYGGQMLTDLGWLNPTFVADKIDANLPADVINKAVPGVSQGSQLNYVTVDGTQLSPYGTNTVAASPAPTFQLHFANSGQTVEYKLGCSVTVDGTSDTGRAIYPETHPGGNYTCDVTLPRVPPTSVFQVTAKIARVPGENDIQNNRLTFKINFN